MRISPHLPCHAYLTLDDTPSRDTDALVDALEMRQIPAVLFVRGDKTEIYGTASVERAIDKGFVIGNHAWTHTRASTIPLTEMLDEIDRTQEMIAGCYARTGVPMTQGLFRFPHLDRGAGGWAVDFDAVPPNDRERVYRLFADGVNADMTPPSAEHVHKKQALQDALRARGFAAPFTGVTFPWYQTPEMIGAVDCLYTFSTSDWMLLPRHQGRWSYATLDDLKEKIDRDSDLHNPASRSIVLAHDADDLLEVTLALIDHLTGRGFHFVPV